MKKNYITLYLKKQILIAFLFCAFKSYAQVPVAKFSANKVVLEIYDGITLTDSSFNNPTQWEWHIYDSVTYKNDQFDPVSDEASGYVTYDNVTSKSSRNPQISFYREGKYTIILRCRNSAGWSTKLVKKDYIKVAPLTKYHLGYGSYGPYSDNIIESDYGTILDAGGANQNYGNNQGKSTRSYLLIQPCRAKEITLKMT